MTDLQWQRCCARRYIHHRLTELYAEQMAAILDVDREEYRRVTKQILTWMAVLEIDNLFWDEDDD